MPVILTGKKESYVNRLRGAVTNTLDSVDTAMDARQGFLFSGFDQGANVLTDAEVQAANPDLAAQDVLNAAAAIVAIDSLLAANGNLHYKALEKLRR